MTSAIDMSSLIVSNKDVLGGTPVIRGTRIPLERLVHLVGNGNVTVSHIKEEYPQLSASKVYKIMAYLMSKGLYALEKEGKAK